MKKIAVYTVKGGAGKSTLAKAIAEGEAKYYGQRVLIGEVDGQANTSKQMLAQRSAVLANDTDEYMDLSYERKEALFIQKFLNQGETESMSNVFSDPRSINDVICNTNVDGIDIIPANLQLFRTDAKLRLEDGRQENRLSRAMNFIDTKYDLCVFDCSPVKSLLISNVMYTDPLVIIPVVPNDDALQGLALVLNELNETRELYDELELDYRIVIMMRSNNNEARANIQYLRSVFTDRVLQSEIRFQNKPIEAACKRRRSVLDDKHAAVAEDLRSFVKEVHDLCETL